MSWNGVPVFQSNPMNQTQMGMATKNGITLLGQTIAIISM